MDEGPTDGRTNRTDGRTGSWRRKGFDRVLLHFVKVVLSTIHYTSERVFFPPFFFPCVLGVLCQPHLPCVCVTVKNERTQKKYSHTHMMKLSAKVK